MTQGLPEAFGILPDPLLKRLQQARRVVLVANNPAISAADVDALGLGPQDVVVSFNTCVKWELLSGEWTNILVHGFNEPDRYFFGLPCRPQVEALLNRADRPGYTMLMGCTGDISPLPGVALVWARLPLPIVAGYPVYRPDGKLFAGPSTGFSTLLLFDWLRTGAGCGFELIALGFSNEAGKLWRGHAWDYERDWLEGSTVRVVKLMHVPKPKAWWKRLFVQG